MSMIQPTSLSLSIGAQPTTGVPNAQQVLMKLKQELNDVTEGIKSLEAIFGGAAGGINPAPFNTGIAGGLGLPNSTVPAPTGLGAGFPSISAGFGLGSGLGTGLGTGLTSGGLFGLPTSGFGGLGSPGLGGSLLGLPSTGTSSLTDPSQQAGSNNLLSTLVPLLLTLVTLLKDKQTSGDNGININNTNNNSANAGSTVAPAPRPVPVPPRPPVSGGYGAPAASAGSVSQAASQGKQNTSIAGSTIKGSSVVSGNDIKDSQVFANTGNAGFVKAKNIKGSAVTGQGPALNVNGNLDLKSIIEEALKVKTA